MRTLTFDPWEFDPPDAEEGLDLHCCEERSFVSERGGVRARAAHGIKSDESLAAPLAFAEELGAANGPGHVRTYLQRYAGVTLPTPCDWPTHVISNEWNDFDAVLVGPTTLIRYHWSTTA